MTIVFDGHLMPLLEGSMLVDLAHGSQSLCFLIATVASMSQHVQVQQAHIIPFVLEMGFSLCHSWCTVTLFMIVLPSMETKSYC